MSSLVRQAGRERIIGTAHAILEYIHAVPADVEWSEYIATVPTASTAGWDISGRLRCAYIPDIQAQRDIYIRIYFPPTLPCRTWAPPPCAFTSEELAEEGPPPGGAEAVQ